MSSEAIEATYELYRARLRAFFHHNARRQGIVDDLMQVLFLRLLRYRPPAVLQSPLKYLYRVAWRVVNDDNRTTRREQAHEVSCPTPELALLADEFNQQWQQEEGGDSLAQEEFERVLGQLPPVCQAVLIMQCRDGHSYKEIGERLGVSVHTVKGYASRALNHFRKHYDIRNTEG